MGKDVNEGEPTSRRAIELASTVGSTGRRSRCALDLGGVLPPKWRNLGGTRVATLNIKNLPDRLYRRLQARAKRERRSVAQEVTHILSEALESPKQLSILELRGLGKEYWQSVDAAAHVERERTAWD